MSVIQPTLSMYSATGLTGGWTSDWQQPYGCSSMSISWLSDVNTTVVINQSPDQSTVLFTDTYSGVGGTAQNQVLNVKSEFIQIVVTFASPPSTFFFETFFNNFFFSNSVSGGWVLLDTQTVSSPTGTINFTSINQSYTNLVIMGNLQNDSTNIYENTLMHFNGDTGSNYIYGQGWYSSSGGSSLVASPSAFANLILSPSSIVNGTVGFSSVTATIYNYSSNTLSKNYESIGPMLIDSTGDLYNFNIGGRWYSSFPITDISLAVDNSFNFTAGTILNLYGVI